MKSDKYFVFACIFAVALPFIIGSSYFYRLYKKDTEEKILATLGAKPELIVNDIGLLGQVSSSVSTSEIYYHDDIIPYDFHITYSGIIPDYRYDITLEPISYSSTLDLNTVEWKLLKYSDMTLQYEPISEGTLNKNGEKIVLVQNVAVQLDEIQKYRLYCYTKIDNYQSAEPFLIALLLS